MKMNWTPKQKLILAIVASTSFMGTFLISSVNIALPAIGKEFGLNSVSLSWVVTSFLLSTAMFLLPVGRWADMTGIRKIYKIGLIIFTLTSLLTPFAGSGTWLIILRFMQGIGAAFTSTTGQAILVSAFPPQNRGRVLGISVSTVYLGLAVGPFAGGMLTQYAGWSSIFWVASFLGLIATIIAFSFLGKDNPLEKATSIKPDLKGITFYMLGLLALVYSSSQIPSVIGWLLMVVGILFLYLFWVFESRSAMPLIDTKLFSNNRLFAFSNIAALVNYTATSAIVFFMSLYLQKILDFPPRVAGLILIAQPVVMSAFSPVVGRLSDKVQPRYLASIGMAMCSLGLFAFSFFNTLTPVWFIVVVLLWVGLGFAFFSSPNMNTIMSSVDKSQLGLASGTAASMRVLGQIISMTIVTLLFALLFSGKAIDIIPHHLFLKAMKLGFIIFAIGSLVGIYFSLNRGKVIRNQE